MEKNLVCKELPTKMCHASTVLKLKNGEFLVAWFGGEKEGSEDTSIWLSKSRKQKFLEPTQIRSSQKAHWNPVLFRLNNDDIVLFYKVGNRIKTWQTMYKISKDEGESWSEAKHFSYNDGITSARGPVRNKPLKLNDGSILFPSSAEDGKWIAFVDKTKDDFKSLQRSNSIEIDNLDYTGGRTDNNSTIEVSEQSFYGRGVIQPTLWEDVEASRVIMLLRSTEGFVYKSISNDKGDTFSPATPTTIPNNNSGIDLVKLDNGLIVLVHNPVSENWGERTPISISISNDGGNTFKKAIDLETKQAEFSYPAIINDSEKVYITYTYKRNNIAFVSVEIKELINWSEGLEK